MKEITRELEKQRVELERQNEQLRGIEKILEKMVLKRCQEKLRAETKRGGVKLSVVKGGLHG